DTTKINLTQNMQVEILLQPISYELNEVVVTPRDNPALRIIRKAIEYKHKRENVLNSYIFKSYTKGIIKTNEPITAKGRGISVETGKESDSTILEIEGIMENESVSYYLKPDYYKDEIIARKQTSNFPSTINLFTGGRFIQNFYTDDVQFFSRPLKSFIADNAIDYYFYYLEDSLWMDNIKIYKILIDTDDQADPGFKGHIYIADSIFSLVKIDVTLNDAANPYKAVLKNIRIFQQFLPYANNIYMPIDYRLFVEIDVSFFGRTLAANFSLNSIFYDYEINSDIKDDFFADDVVIKIHQDADEKDSTYWKNTQTIPGTVEEDKAYAKIDSIMAIPPDSTLVKFSLWGTKLNFSENFQLSGPIGISHYHFNRVEGHTIDSRLTYDEIFNEGSYSWIDFDYGFNDKKFKTDFGLRYRFGKNDMFRLSIDAFDKLKYLFDDRPISNTEFLTTMTCLFSKWDFLEYHYSSGANITFWTEIHPKINLSLGLSHTSDRTAQKNSDFSILYTNDKYNENIPIYDTKINALTTQINFTFRKLKFFEDGKQLRKLYVENEVVNLSLQGIFSNSKILNSNLDFALYKAMISSTIEPFGTTRLDSRITAVYSNGPVPFQMLNPLTGNLNKLGREFTFRTLSLYEIFGDRVLSLNLEYNLFDEFFRFLKFPLLKDLQLYLCLHFNAAYLDISDKSKNILTVPYKTFTQPFYEIGFSIGKIVWLLPLSVEFTWKLNHRDGNNFMIGLGMFEF
ncbi:MAG: hypothetical protein JW866_03430, partial [Ignavibacteriales bacterium]|nr:hypothetical protein [Ignavibacteriales bacterium]